MDLRCDCTHARLGKQMNETTMILCELRALAEQIDHLECQARVHAGDAERQNLHDLHGQASALHDMMTRANPRMTYRSGSEASFSCATPNRAAGIVARLGVRPDHLFEALHARNAARA